MEPDDSHPLPTADDPGSGGKVKGPRPTSSPRWTGRRAITAVFTVVVVAFVIVALVRNWSEVRAELELVGAGDLVGSAIVAVLALIASWTLWVTVMSDLGAGLRQRDGLAIFFSGQVGKYVPGSVWTAVIQTQLGRANGVRRATMVAGYALSTVITVATAGLIGPLLLANDPEPWVVAVAIGAFIAGVAGFAGIGHPQGVARLSRWIADRTGRELPDVALRARPLAVAGMQGIVVWILYGVHAWLIARALGADLSDLLPTIAGFALAFVAGLVVLPLPAGAGVREAVLVIALSASLDRPAALSVAIISRFTIMVAELGIAGVCGVPHAIRSARRLRADPSKEPFDSVSSDR